jgi:hypothetical protein
MRKLKFQEKLFATIEDILSGEGNGVIGGL